MASTSGSRGQTSPILHTRLDDDQMFEDHYEIKSKIGKGTFGVVYEVVHKIKNKKAACKIVMRAIAGHAHLTLLEREMDILKLVKHDHIIKLHEIFETPKKMMLVMELCAGELSKVLKERRRFEEQDVKTVMSRLCDAISYLHKIDIMHRDLKLENVLTAANPDDPQDQLYVKVTDFGLSVKKEGVGQENMKMDKCGTPNYMAPEIIDSKCYSEKCDVWALGVMMFYLISGTLPFQASSESKLHELIKEAAILLQFEKDTVWAGISEEAKDLLLKMLDRNPAHRVTAQEALNHKWLTGKNQQKNVLELMREYLAESTKGVETVNEDNGSANNHGSSCASAPTQRKKEKPSSASNDSHRPNSSGSASAGNTSFRNGQDKQDKNSESERKAKKLVQSTPNLLTVPLQRPRRRSDESISSAAVKNMNRSSSSSSLSSKSWDSITSETSRTRVRPNSNNQLNTTSTNNTNKSAKYQSKSRRK
ncbi:DgyrCDS445 [Dimorphilus gyrociliatus]|uniref:DgyrCDS445 n=1 Tax=Dimorphilus gyrociliatus TaxID=2664684 RepID=A0A7I8V6E2_9ANNE|nr:DgyrCDS445 [Dimorphilus gyrociliatus]